MLNYLFVLPRFIQAKQHKQQNKHPISPEKQSCIMANPNAKL